MTYKDDRNGRMYQDPQRNGTSAAVLGALALAALLIVGGLYYGMSDNRSTTASNPTTTSSTPSTTGQGRTQVMPGEQQNIPNPGTPPR
jgi:hypothetical protein